MTIPATGTVTLLFSDIEGSTKLVGQLGDRYEPVLADHRRLLREAFRSRGGSEVDTAGDGLFYAFPSARAAIAAAVAGQRALSAQDWPADVRVRMGIHTGEPISGEAGYVGMDVHRASRICNAGHGGQVLVSKTSCDLAQGELPDEVSLLDLGEHRLKDLPSPDRLFQVVAPGLGREFPPLRSIDSRPNNLPRQLTAFIGRQREIGEAKRILAGSPLLTLTGPGGVGKTRLAVEVAGDLLDEYEDGVWFVDLGPVTDPTFVAHAIASTLGVMDVAGQPILDTVVDHVRRRHILLVLDNCEHLLDAAATAVDGLLRASAQLRVVATSREGFAIPGEAVFPVPSLSAPDEAHLGTDDLAQFEAVRLFSERAAAAQPGFRVTERNARAVAQICRRLDGVPLALELAAARVRALPVEQIAGRLDDRFRLLTGSSRITVPRHQTLRQTIDWSHDLLADDERIVFRRLASFAGGCTLEAAEAVCAGDPVDEYGVLDVLSRLVDKSLVVADTDAEEARYRQLETIRQYGRDRLLEAGEGPATLRRHRDWFLALVGRAAPEFFRGVESAQWLERLDHEHDNLRAALQWSTDEPAESTAALRLAAGLWRFWEIRGHIAEGRSWLEQALAQTDGEVSALRADAFTGAGILAFMQGDHAAAHEFHEQSLALHREVGDYMGIAFAANNLANAAVLSGDYAAARRLYEPGLAWARSQSNKRPLGFALVNMAEAVALDGEPDVAREQYEEGIETFRSLGDRWGEAFALDSLGTMLGRQGSHAESERLHGRALAISRELRDQRGEARALTHLGDQASRTKDLGQARQLYRQSFEIRHALGDRAGMASALEKLATVVSADDAHSAAVLLGSAEAVRDSIRAPVPPTVRAEYEACRQTVRELLGEAAFEDARAEGRRLSPAATLATLPL
ncbi:MAG TPA: tetratricopeptide repeat protein [Candidatus Limnocylindrales bacterium]|nr:tetratricopeptide repeat protein [Candidatus Limnocylindrales bacterium]